jgi:hypothetical protein
MINHFENDFEIEIEEGIQLDEDTFNFENEEDIDEIE